MNELMKDWTNYLKNQKIYCFFSLKSNLYVVLIYCEFQGCHSFHLNLVLFGDSLPLSELDRMMIIKGEYYCYYYDQLDYLLFGLSAVALMNWYFDLHCMYFDQLTKLCHVFYSFYRFVYSKCYCFWCSKCYCSSYDSPLQTQL